MRRGSRGGGGVPREKRCLRESCRERRKQGQYCGSLCYHLDRELEDTRRLIETMPSGRVSAQLWSSLVAVSDGLTEARSLKRTLQSIRQRETLAAQSIYQT